MRFASLLFLLCFILSPGTSVRAQNQIGNDIYGTNPNRPFGDAVALNEDGTRIVVGSPGGGQPAEGFVRVFERNGGQWAQVGGDLGGTGMSNTVGSSVAISADGNRIAYSILFDNDIPAEVRLLNWNGQQWTTEATILGIDPNDDSFGFALALSADGDTFVAGAPFRTGTGNVANYGAVEVFRKMNGNWVLVGDAFGGGGINENLGFAVAITDDGNRIAYTSRDGTFAGSRNSGYTLVYDYDGATWNQVGETFGGNGEFGDTDALGLALSMTPDGSRIAVGGAGPSGRGAYRVVEFDGNDWVRLGEDYIGESGAPGFGETIALNDDGDRLVLSSPRLPASGGGVYVEQLENGAWTEGEADLTHPDGDLGFAIALSGKYLAVTQPTGQNTAGQNVGTVRVYDITNPTATDSPLPPTAKIWPNPVGDQLSVSGVAFSRAEVTDVYGRRVLTVSGRDTLISTAGLAPGAYLLRLRTAEGWVTGKFVRR